MKKLLAVFAVFCCLAATETFAQEGTPPPGGVQPMPMDAGMAMGQGVCSSAWDRA